MPIYRGIADELGIEHIEAEWVLTQGIVLRARMNGHRHAILFEIDLPVDVGIAITELMKTDPREALEMLKLCPNLMVSKKSEAERIPYYPSNEPRKDVSLKEHAERLQHHIDHAYENMDAIERAKLKAQAMRKGLDDTA